MCACVCLPVGILYPFLSLKWHWSNSDSQGLCIPKRLTSWCPSGPQVLPGSAVREGTRTVRKGPVLLQGVFQTFQHWVSEFWLKFYCIMGKDRIWTCSAIELTRYSVKSIEHLSISCVSTWRMVWTATAFTVFTLSGRNITNTLRLFSDTLPFPPRLLKRN